MLDIALWKAIGDAPCPWQGRFVSQRAHHALDVSHPLANQLRAKLAEGFKRHIIIVLTRVLEVIKRGTKGIIEVTVAGAN